MTRVLAAVGALLAVCGCAPGFPTAPACPAVSPPGSVYLISHGWHTDLAFPTAGLTGGLAVLRRIFPGARVVVVGFGRRTFLIAPARTLADYLVGPLPGRGALQVLALSAPPQIAYDSGTIAVLEPTPDQRRRLDDAVWSSFRTDARGAPVPIAPGRIPGSLFYASTLGYSGLYTCNTWTADMLARAGLPISPALDVFASQTMNRATKLTDRSECRIGGG